MVSLRSKKVSTKTMIMMKPMFCRSKSNTLPKPEKISMDRSWEFTGETFQFLRQIDIGLYSTHSETKLAFAEKNIRLLKARFFPFLNKNSTNTYIENLKQFIKVINSRMKRIIKLAPKDVGRNDVQYLISLQRCNRFGQPNHKIGLQWKIKRKIETFHRGYRIPFTEEVFNIAAL